MKKRTNTNVRLYISFAMIIVIVASAMAVLVACNRNGKLSLNYTLGAAAVEKVENAQYTPDIDKYLEANAQQASPMGVSAKTTDDEFAALIDEYATVENYAGAGKYLGYDIYEIKNEVKFVVEKVPAFNQWFRMPLMREEQGFASIPYYENWAYYLEMDEETSMLSVTRVCWATRSSYLDFENSKTVEYNEDGSMFIQYEIMKTNYLETESDEIVECFIYSVGIDRVGQDMGYYNENADDYYPFEYQYLRNVKDKSMVKYHITAANRYRSEHSFDEGGMDIRGLTPYGVRREFTVVNYDGYTDIDVTKIDQKFATLNEPNNNGDVDFDVDSNNIRILLDTIGYTEDVSALSAKALTDEISKHIIDNFEIKNNWQTIFKEQNDAIEVESLYGPFYGKDMPLTNVGVYVSCRSWGQDVIEFDAGADIYDTSKFDIDKEYSLSMALKSRETGKLYIIATKYGKIQKVIYNGSDDDFYYILGSSQINVSASSIAVDEDGTYDIVGVLTVKENGEDVVLFDTQEIGFLMGYYGLNIPDSVDANGIAHRYDVKSTGGKITISVTSEE